MTVNRRNFLKILGTGLAYACAPVVFLKEKVTSWTGVSGGIFSITIDGESVDVSSLDFSGLNSIDSVSDIISKEAEKRGAFCSMNKNGYLKFNKITGDT